MVGIILWAILILDGILYHLYLRCRFYVALQRDN